MYVICMDVYVRMYVCMYRGLRERQGANQQACLICTSTLNKQKNSNIKRGPSVSSPRYRLNGRVPLTPVFQPPPSSLQHTDQNTALSNFTIARMPTLAFIHSHPRYSHLQPLPHTNQVDDTLTKYLTRMDQLNYGLCCSPLP